MALRMVLGFWRSVERDNLLEGRCGNLLKSFGRNVVSPKTLLKRLIVFWYEKESENEGRLEDVKRDHRIRADCQKDRQLR